MRVQKKLCIEIICITKLRQWLYLVNIQRVDIGHMPDHFGARDKYLVADITYVVLVGLMDHQTVEGLG